MPPVLTAFCMEHTVHPVLVKMSVYTHVHIHILYTYIYTYTHVYIQTYTNICSTVPV